MDAPLGGKGFKTMTRDDSSWDDDDDDLADSSRSSSPIEGPLPIEGSLPMDESSRSSSPIDKSPIEGSLPMDESLASDDDMVGFADANSAFDVMLDRLAAKFDTDKSRLLQALANLLQTKVELSEETPQMEG